LRRAFAFTGRRVQFDEHHVRVDHTEMILSDLVATSLSSTAVKALGDLTAIIRRRRHETGSSGLVASVADAKRLVELAEETLEQAVAWERAKGTSWEAIGQTLGVTRSTAHGRFSAQASSNTSAHYEEELLDKWAEVFDIAESVVRPATNSASHLDRQSSRALVNAAEAIIGSQQAPANSRLQAATLLAAVEPLAGERALRELTETLSPPVLDRLSRSAKDKQTDSEPLFSLQHQIDVLSLPHARPAGPESSDDLDQVMLVYRRLVSTRPPSHPDAPQAVYGLATALLARHARHGSADDLDEAIALLRHATREESGRRADVLSGRLTLGWCLLERFRLTGDVDELHDANRIVGSIIDAYKAEGGQQPSDQLVQAWQLMAFLQTQSHDWDSADFNLWNVINTRATKLGPRHPALIENFLQLAALHAARSDFHEALILTRRAVENAENGLDPTHDLTLQARRLLIALLLAADEQDAEHTLVDELDALTRAYVLRDSPGSEPHS
jgi:hypothetical protein